MCLVITGDDNDDNDDDDDDVNVNVNVNDKIMLRDDVETMIIYYCRYIYIDVETRIVSFLASRVLPIILGLVLTSLFGATVILLTSWLYFSSVLSFFCFSNAEPRDSLCSPHVLCSLTRREVFQRKKKFLKNKNLNQSKKKTSR